MLGSHFAPAQTKIILLLDCSCSISRRWQTRVFNLCQRVSFYCDSLSFMGRFFCIGFGEVSRGLFDAIAFTSPMFTRFSCLLLHHHTPPCYYWSPSSLWGFRFRASLYGRLAPAQRVSDPPPLYCFYLQIHSFSLARFHKFSSEKTLGQNTFMIVLKHWLTKVWIFLMIDLSPSMYRIHTTALLLHCC